MLIDDTMPAHDVLGHHELIVSARAKAIFDTVKQIDFAQSLAIRALLVLRGIPQLVQGTSSISGSLDLDFLMKTGFVMLAEDPGREIVLGVAGRFWQLDGGIVRVSPQEFESLELPNLAKATLNFAAHDLGEGKTKLATETRVQYSDDRARRNFRIYWRVIGPFSGFIRTQMLKLIAREVEGADRAAVSS